MPARTRAHTQGVLGAPWSLMVTQVHLEKPRRVVTKALRATFAWATVCAATWCLLAGGGGRGNGPEGGLCSLPWFSHALTGVPRYQNHQAAHFSNVQVILCHLNTAVSFLYFWTCPWHKEFRWPGIEPKLRQWQCWIPNPRRHQGLPPKSSSI